MIFVDTSAWFAAIVPTDHNHEPAYEQLRRSVRSGEIVTTDYIIDELLTLLRSRGESRRCLQTGAKIIEREFSKIEFVTREDFIAAWEIFRSFQDKGWSFTDCTSRVIMQRLGIRSALAFDDHFRQFGDVQVLP